MIRKLRIGFLFYFLTAIFFSSFLTAHESVEMPPQMPDQKPVEEKLTLILDWYLNPNHAPLIVAQQIGAFADLGLQVELISPSDPTIGPRLVAAKQADLALSYQQQLYMSQEETIPLLRIGTLIDTPLNSLMALPDSKIKTPLDLKGKKIGVSASGIEQALLETILKNVGLELNDVTLIHVNFNLVSALLSKQVDAIIGAYRNVEANEIQQYAIHPVIMKVEDYGIPPYDELVIVAHKDNAKDDKIRKFLIGLARGAAYLRQHPQKTWEIFSKAYPENNNELTKKIWMQTVSVFSKDPAFLDYKKYYEYGLFLYRAKLIPKIYKVEDYAIEIK